MNDMHCTHCGHTELEPGFLEDAGDSSRGYSRWIAGALELGVFGGARRFGKRRFAVVAHRCTQCAHLELFVP